MYARIKVPLGSDAYVGPFATQTEIDAHVALCNAAGLPTVCTEVVPKPPQYEVVFTPQEDRDLHIG
jgi:hypothetical protein